MSDASSGADRAPIERLAEEFVARYRTGERPPLSEFTARHPELAGQIKELFPALVLMEQFKPATIDNTGSIGGSSSESNGAMPDHIGDYRLLREIGRGGMGVVYEAEQVSLGRHVALKVLTGQARLDARHLARFEREAKAAARLHHTNIVPVYGVGSDDGLHYYVMQYIAGMGLDAVLAEMRRLDPKGTHQPGKAALSVEDVARSLSTDKAASSSVTLPGQTTALSNRSETGRTYWHSVVRVGVQVADALHYAHQHGILHRDVKPSNLLLDGQGVVWVTDFGLAKADDSADLTHTGDIVGTLRYMAPERFNGQGDVRSDVYSLGLTLYELLALRPAFNTPDRNKLLREVMDAEPPRLAQLVPGLPRDLETIVHKAMAREPNDRYASGQELAADLRRFVEDRPIAARRASRTERLWRLCRRNPAVAALVLAVGVVFAVGSLAASYYAVMAHYRELDAIAAVKQADTNADQAGANARRAEEKTHESLSRQAQLQVERGNRLLDVGDTPGALLCFTEALRLEEGQPEREAIHRSRIGFLLRRCPLPQAAWSVEGPLLQARFSPDGSRLVTVRADPDPKGPGNGNFVNLWYGTEARVWDAATGQPLTPPLRFKLGVYEAAFSPDSRYVVVVGSDGDPSTLGPPSSPMRMRRYLKLCMVWDVVTGRTLTAPLPCAGLPKISADGSRMLLPTAELGLEVRELPGGALIGTLPINRNTDSRIFLLRPDGKEILSGGQLLGRIDRATKADDQRLKIFPPDGGVPLRSLNLSDGVKRPGLGEVMTSFQATYSPDGRRLLVTINGKARVHDAVSGDPTGPPLAAGPVTGHSSEASDGHGAARLSPDGRRVYTISPDGELRTWDTETGALLALGRPAEAHPVSHFQADRNGHRLLTVTNDGVVQVWDAETATASTPPLCGPVAIAATFSPDGRRVTVLDGKGSVVSWDLAAAEPEGWNLGMGSGTSRPTFTPDGGRVLVAEHQQMPVHAWNLETAQPSELPLNWPGTALQGSLSSDGRRSLTIVNPIMTRPQRNPIVSAPGDEAPSLRESRNVSMARSVAANAMLAFSGPLDVRPLLILARRSSPRFPEPGKLVGFSEVSVWDATFGRPLFPPLHEDKATQLAWLSPDGQRLLTSKEGRDSEFVLRDAQTAKPLLPPRLLDGTVSFGVISPDGHRVALNYSFPSKASLADLGPGRGRPQMPVRKTEVWDMSTLQTIATLELPPTAGALLSVAFNGDGTLLLANEYSAAAIYDAGTGRCLRELPVKKGSACTCAVFSPDFVRVLVGTRQGTARVYDTRSGEPLTPPLEHGNPMHNGCFSPDGRFVLTFSADGAFRLWDASNGDPVTPAPGASSGQDPQRPREGVYSSGLGYDMVHFGSKGDYLWVLDPDESREPWLLRFDCRPDPRPLADLIAMAESLAGRRLAIGGFALLDAEQIRSRQQGLHASAGPATLLQAVTWHRREADRCIRADQWGAAIEQLTLAAGLVPDQAWPHRTLGFVYAQQERWVEAVAAFGRAAARRPQGEDAALQAMARLAGGDPVGYHQNCLDLLRKFKHPEDPDAADVVASLCLLDTGPDRDWTAALALAEKAVAANATDPGYLATLGGILYRAGRPEEAIARLKEAIEMGNKDRSTWALLALAHHVAGHSDEARACLQKARALPDQIPDILKPRLLLWMVRLSNDIPLREAESEIK